MRYRRLPISAVMLAAMMAMTPMNTLASQIPESMQESNVDAGNMETEAVGADVTEAITEMNENAENAESVPEGATTAAQNNIETTAAKQESEAITPISETAEETLPLKAETDPSESQDDDITLLNPTTVDADGNVIISVSVAENVTLPLTVTIKGEQGEAPVQFTVARNGQEIKIKPDVYKIQKAVDGNNKKLSNGAYLNIEHGGDVYLDFTKPEKTGGMMFDNIWSNLVFSNLLFVATVIGLYFAYRAYRKKNPF